MPKYNRKCFYCGDEYYCCSSCVSINSWKNVYCSIDCFLKSQEKNNIQDIKPIIVDKGGKNMGVLKAALKKNGRTIDIIGYDLDLGKFDCSDGSTKILEDFDYFIVSASEMSHYTLKPKKDGNKRRNTDSLKNTNKDVDDSDNQAIN